MMIAIRGASASDALDKNRSSAVSSPRRATLLRVAVHHRADLQMLNGLSQLHVGFAIQQA